MGMLFKIAWRNVLRNKRRTFLSGLAVGLGLASLMFVSALLAGMFEGMIRTATDTFLGHGEIHAEGYRDAPEVENAVRDAGAVLAGLEGEKLVERFSPRVISQGMVGSAAGAQAVVVYGIEPEREKDITLVDEAVIAGKYLDPSDDRGILIGDRLAETLEASPGDRLVLTVAQARSGDLSQEMFRVSGIFRIGEREMDSSMAFITLREAQRLLAIGGGVHEVVLRFKRLEDAGNPALPFWKKYSRGGNEALGWRQLVPQLDGAISLSRVSKAISLLLVFAVVALTIMNTLFMSLYERMFEFGVLRALGTRPSRMAAIILMEAASLSLISIAMGAALGLAVIWYFSVYGIDYRGIEFAGVTISDYLYPVLEPAQFTLYPLLIFLFSMVAALYPAAYAAKLTPARAMQRSL